MTPYLLYTRCQVGQTLSATIHFQATPRLYGLTDEPPRTH